MEERETLKKIFEEWSYLEEAEDILSNLLFLYSGYNDLSNFDITDEEYVKLKNRIDKHFNIDDSE